jgi:hypothetical protein
MLSQVCANLTAAATPLDGLAAATALFANQSAPFKERCLQSSWKDDQIGALTNVTFDGESAMRQWIWQSCNEFGFFQTTSGADHPFTAFKALGLELAGTRVCEEAYGLKRYRGPNTQWANTNYGSRDLQGSNIAIVNGNMDPWHALGLVNASDKFHNSCVGGGSCKPQAISPSEQLVFIDGTAHCRDMYAPGAFEAIGIADTPPVVWAHAKIANAVASFLK